MNSETALHFSPSNQDASCQKPDQRSGVSALVDLANRRVAGWHLPARLPARLLGRRLLAAVVCAAGFATGQGTHAAVVHLAVASNFAKPIQTLVSDFEQSHPHQVKVSLGSTGKLLAQIQHGAPFDVLMSADQERPQWLEAQGMAVAQSRRTYATGRLVLWSADAKRFAATQPRDLWPADAGVPTATERAAIANPKLAPYGLAAQQVLARAGVAQTWQARLVTGENIAQTHQFVASGNAALGLVARSQVMDGDRITSGSGWPVPPDWHAPIAQDAVWLKRAKDNLAAKAWMQYLTSPRATALIRAAGYGAPH